MLSLTLKPNSKIVIFDTKEMKEVVSIHGHESNNGKKLKIGFEGSKRYRIHREKK